jgi:hypothetical protein
MKFHHHFCNCFFFFNFIKTTREEELLFLENAFRKRFYDEGFCSIKMTIKKNLCF